MKTLILPLFFVFAVTFISCDSDEDTDCCKTCTTGKACGDTCISKSDNCNVGKGCACDG